MAKRKKEKDQMREISVREKIADLFEIPDELIADVPRITITSNRKLLIQNYIGMLEYDREVIRVNTKIGVIKITGKNLEIETITAEEVMIVGFITNIIFAV